MVLAGKSRRIRASTGSGERIGAGLREILAEQCRDRTEGGAFDIRKQTVFFPDGRKAGASLLKPDMTSQAMDVEAIALDEYFKPTEAVAAIKIDVEGSELDVLLGAQRTINRCMPLLVVECDRHLVSIGRMNDAFSFLKDLGYSASFVNKGRILPLSAFDPVAHQSDDVDRFWRKRGYSNNFIFTKED
jgi:hypothetical protein